MSTAVAQEPKSRWCTVVFWQWLCLLALFFFGRLFYLVAYRGALAAEPWTTKELVAALASAFRFDASVSALLLAPSAIVAIIFTVRPVGSTSPSTRWVHRGLRGWGSLVAVLAWLTVIVDHYFYLYFHDHFNVFFWEFFENFSNAALVIGGLGDSVPLTSAVPLLIGGSFFWSIVAARCLGPRLARAPWERWGRRQLWLWVPLYLLAARGTLLGPPLALQERRLLIARNTVINLLNTNPLLPLYRSWLDNQDVQTLAADYQESAAAVSTHFKHAAAFVPGAIAKVGPGGYHYLSQHIEPLGGEILRRKPRHVVILFMESYARWLIDFDDPTFAQTMGEGLRTLRSQGLFFSRHFSAAGGTIKNIIAANLSFPVARDFFPALVYHREGYKPFPSRLAPLMKQLGYKPHFFYGGSGAWHRLLQFGPAIGYEAFMAEHNFPERPHHDYGLYDEDLLSEVLASIKNASEPTFSFVMSLTNHPPFSVPPGRQEPPITVPSALAAKVLDAPEQFMKRLVAFRHADQSVLAFARGLTAAGLTDETLLVVTGDHAFSGGIAFGSDFTWRAEQIPLLFWGGVLKEELKGEVRTPFTTHLDLAPSLAALLAEKSFDLPTFGKVIFKPGAPEATGINHYFSCIDGVCLKDGRLTRLTPEELLVDTPSQEGRAAIEAMERDYYGAAMHFLYAFKPGG